MSLSSELIEHIARLSRLKLDEKHTADLTTDMGNILGFIDQVNAYTLPDNELTTHQAAQQPFRSDDRHDSPPDRETIQHNAPSVDGGLYLVPDVIDTPSE